MARTRTQWRVICTREGGQRSVKTFGSLKAVLDRVGMLTSPEPWRFFGSESERQREGTEYVCCAGTRYDECGCGGLTLAEDTVQRRKDLPPIVSVTVQKRQVTRTPWELHDEPAPYAREDTP